MAITASLTVTVWSAMCWHKYEYVGWIEAQKWLGGVAGGILIDVMIKAKQCTKCGNVKEIL